MPPTLVAVGAKVDLHERPPLRSCRRSDQFHPCFLRSAVGLSGVAWDARTDNVFPVRGPPTISRDDVIQVEIRSIQNLAAVLTRILVALKNIVPGKLDFLLRETIEDSQ